MQPELAQPGAVHEAAVPPLLGVHARPATEHEFVYCSLPDDRDSHVVRLSPEQVVPVAVQAVVVARHALDLSLSVQHVEPVAHDSVAIPRLVVVSVETHV